MISWLMRKLGWEKKLRQKLTQLQAETEQHQRDHLNRKRLAKTLRDRKK